MSDSDTHHVWQRTLALLAQLSAPENALAAMPRFGNNSVAKQQHVPKRSIGRMLESARFTLVERVSDRTILIRWRDATVGHYAEQPWMKGIARRSTFCVLSGLRIRRGDSVYRPFTRGRPWANGEQVVLAIMVDGLTASDC